MIPAAVLSGGERRKDDFYPTPKEATLPCGLWLLIKNDTVVTVTPDKPKSILPVLEYQGPGKPRWKHASRRRFK